VEVVGVIVRVAVLVLEEAAVVVDVRQTLRVPRECACVLVVTSVLVDASVVLVVEVEVKVIVLVDGVVMLVSAFLVDVVVCVRVVGDVELEVSTIRELEALEANVPLQTTRCRQHHSIWLNDQSSLQLASSSHS